MKKLFPLVLLAPLISLAQKSLPRFENDTLFTSCGYKIYNGQLLHLANGTSSAGYFKFLKFHFNQGKTNTYSLQNGSILVNKLKNYKNTGDGNSSIRIFGMATYQDGTKEDVDIILNFDRAIENYAGQPAEIIVPNEFANKQLQTVKAEVKKQTVPVEINKQITPDPVKKQAIPDENKKLTVADEIRKLFELYKEGALTKEEFEAAKKKVLEKQ
jgi:hypothetical protein